MPTLLERCDALPDVLKQKIMGYYPGPAPKYLRQLKRQYGYRDQMKQCSSCLKFYQCSDVMECNGYFMPGSECEYGDIQFCIGCTVNIFYDTREGFMCFSCCRQWHDENRH